MKPIFSFKQFPGGEPHVTVMLPTEMYPVERSTLDHTTHITARIYNWNALGRLAVLNDALRRMGAPRITVTIPYFPGGRQDRVANPGEALTVKVYADFINSLKFDKVFITDPHSDVTPALINNVGVIPLAALLAGERSMIDFDVVICPDAGASKRIHGIFALPMVQCTKHRDTETGRLSDFVVHTNTLEGKRCLIVDDICDGGGTFVALAAKLRAKGAAYIGLYVTHGIFSQGLDVLFRNGIDRVITTNAFSEVSPEVIAERPNFSVINYFSQDDISR